MDVAVESESNWHRNLIVLIGIVALLVIGVRLGTPRNAGYLLPLLSVVLVLELLLLTFTVKLDRLPDPWATVGPAFILVAAGLIVVVGYLALLARGGRLSYMTLGAVIGVVVGLVVLRLDQHIIDRPRVVKVLLGVLVVVGVASGVVAIAHTAGIWPAGRRATITAGGHIGFLATISAYVAYKLWRGGPSSVFPGTVAYLAR